MVIKANLAIEPGLLDTRYCFSFQDQIVLPSAISTLLRTIRSTPQLV